MDTTKTVEKLLREVEENSIINLGTDDPTSDYVMKKEEQGSLRNLKNMNVKEGASKDDMDIQYQVQMVNLQILKDAMVQQEAQLSRLREQGDIWHRSVLLWDSLQGEEEVVGKMKEIPHYLTLKEEFRLHLVLQEQLQQQILKAKEEQRDEEERDKTLFKNLKTSKAIQERIARGEAGKGYIKQLSVEVSDLSHQVDLLQSVNKENRDRALDYKGKGAQLRADNQAMREEIPHVESKIQRSLEEGLAQRERRKEEEQKKQEWLKMTMGNVETRMSFFKETLEAPKIDLRLVGEMCSFGIPQGCHRERAICWRLLLGYLPSSTNDWERVLSERRALYHSFCRDLDPGRCFWKTKPGEKYSSSSLPTSPSFSASSSSSCSTLPPMPSSSSSSESLSSLSASSPPSTGKFSVSSLPILPILLKRYPAPPPRKSAPGQGAEEEGEKENNEEGKEEGEEEEKEEEKGDQDEEKEDPEHFMSIIPKIFPPNGQKPGDGPLDVVNEYLLKEVCKDVPRTLPDLNFFCDAHGQGVTEHYFAVARILYIYAALNPGISYVQGMNEIVAPMYYLFVHDIDVDDEWHPHAEADAFFCFTSIMGEIRDFFCKSLDASSVGIRYQISRLSSLLKRADPEVWNDMEEKQLLFEYFAFRWISVLLSQEYKIEQIFRIWDVLFADAVTHTNSNSNKRFSFLVYICCAMIMKLRNQLLEGAFSDNVKLLLRFPNPGTHGVDEILSQAKALREKIPVEEIFSNE